MKSDLIMSKKGTEAYPFSYVILITFILNSLSPTADAQQPNGINWQRHAGLKETISKAKNENKLIFYDCFATWCGPCKQMDKYVYTDDSVSQYFNKYFHSVRIQMDRTKFDDSLTISSYSSTDSIRTQFKITSFPTLLFLSPSGKLLRRVIGFKSTISLIQLAESILNDSATNNKFEEYQRKVDMFNAGKKDYINMPELIEQALTNGDVEMSKKLALEYCNYLEERPGEEQFYPTNIRFMARMTTSEKSPYVLFLLLNEEKVGKIMNDINFSKRILDKIIRNEIIGNYFARYPNFNVTSVSTISRKFDSIFIVIKNKYGMDYANRNILYAKYNLNFRKRQYTTGTTHYLNYLNKYGIDTLNPSAESEVNYNLYNVFLYVSQNKLIRKAKDAMCEIVKRHPQDIFFLDTYACLLYKMGEVDKAIKIEMEAYKIASTQGLLEYSTEYQDKLEKMKKGDPTWL